MKKGEIGEKGSGSDLGGEMDQMVKKNLKKKKN